MAKSFILTDTKSNINIQDFYIDRSSNLLNLNQWHIKKYEKQGGLEKGIEILEIALGDLSFDFCPTRGMGIIGGRLGNKEIGWDSPISEIINPQFINLEERNGLGWLRGFNEFFVRCGIEFNGAPGIDEVIDNNGNLIKVPLTLHGKIGLIPCSYLETEFEKSSNRVIIKSSVYERIMFGPNYRLDTTYIMDPAKKSLEIKDEIFNLCSFPVEIEMLYHINYGKTLLNQNSKLEIPYNIVAPRDEVARNGINNLNNFYPPTPQFIEEAFFYDVQEEKDNKCYILLKNTDNDFASLLSYNKKSLPCLTVWKNCSALQDGYVVGLEPGTDYPHSRKHERRMGRVKKLNKGEKYEINIEITFLTGEKIEEASSKISSVNCQKKVGEIGEFDKKLNINV